MQTRSRLRERVELVEGGVDTAVLQFPRRPQLEAAPRLVNGHARANQHFHQFAAALTSWAFLSSSALGIDRSSKASPAAAADFAVGGAKIEATLPVAMNAPALSKNRRRLSPGVSLLLPPPPLLPTWRSADDDADDADADGGVLACRDAVEGGENAAAAASAVDANISTATTPTSRRR